MEPEMDYGTKGIQTRGSARGGEAGAETRRQGRPAMSVMSATARVVFPTPPLGLITQTLSFRSLFVCKNSVVV